MIGVITYNVPHKKTQDVLFRLRAEGYLDVECIALPFIRRKQFKPMVNHRIGKALPIEPGLFCVRLGYGYTEKVDLKKYDKILIGGANILSKEFIGDNEIINAHPGYLPYVRGLDALKWAILEGHPIGATSHVINEDIDAGYMIDRRLVSVDYFDTLHSLGVKTYQLEIDLLIEAINNPTREAIVEKGMPRRRMPHRLEIQIIDKLK